MLKPEQLIVGGKYKLVEPIGSGSFGDVWLALEVKSNTQVAIKVGRAGDRESQERSDREVVCRRFDHPHLLRADTVEQEGEALYLVFPYAAGGSLRQRLEERKRLPADEAAGIVVAIGDGLGYLHQRDFVHRDVHPGNILFTADGVVKLSDFGLVQSHLFSYDLWYGRRIGGRQPGNALYQPPEAWAEEGRPLKPLDPNADVYMLGAVVWEMLTGRIHYHNRGKPVRALQPDIPEWLDELLQRCLDEEPAARPENGSQLARLLQEGQAAEEQRTRRANLYQRGKDALESGEWPAAIEALEALVRETPDHEDAAELLRHAREAGERIQSAGSLVSQLGALSGKHRAAGASARRPGETILTPPGERERQSGLPPALLGVAGLAAVGLLVVGAVAALVVSGMLGGGRPTPTPAVAALPTEPPAPTPVPGDTSAPPTPIPAYAAGDVFIRPADQMEMVYVPAGEFTMGSPDGEGQSDEHPRHTVYLDAFWIDRYEVTNDQYRQCVLASTCDVPTSCHMGEAITYGDAGKEDHPVECVSWYNAEAYCEWASARLPTEAEWEKAARGTDGRVYPWGDEWEAGRCNTIKAFGDGTESVGTYSPGGDSLYGCADMAGNVWEWVADWYDGDYYSRSPGSNPPGPDSGNRRVVRGGSWTWFQNRARSGNRGWGNPVNSVHDYGFRCCVS